MTYSEASWQGPDFRGVIIQDAYAFQHIADWLEDRRLRKANTDAARAHLAAMSKDRRAMLYGEWA